MAIYLQYMGPKEQKEVIFVGTRPVFNKANNYTAVLPEQDAGQIMRVAPKLFRVVDDMKQERPKEVEEAAEEAQVPRRRRSEPEPYGGVDEETSPPNQPLTPADQGRQLFGKADGTPYASAGAARMQLPRLAKKQGVEEDTMTVVPLDDGFYLGFAEDEE